MLKHSTTVKLKREHPTLSSIDIIRPAGVNGVTYLVATQLAPGIISIEWHRIRHRAVGQILIPFALGVRTCSAKHAQNCDLDQPIAKHLADLAKQTKLALHHNLVQPAGWSHSIENFFACYKTFGSNIASSTGPVDELFGQSWSIPVDIADMLMKYPKTYPQCQRGVNHLRKKFHSSFSFLIRLTLHLKLAY